MGQVMVYDAMDGGGRPQTLCVVFTGAMYFGMDAQATVSAPLWFRGRTWGQSSDSLRLESRFETGIAREFAKRGA